ncbi:MAG: RNA polymerase sigma factor [Planctomycetota bacterium]
MMTTQEITAQLLRERIGLTAQIYSIVRNYHLAEDIYQEICVKALDQTGKVESKDHLIHWFRKVARNRSIDVLRLHGERNRQLSEQTLALLEDTWDEGREAANASIVDALSRCVDQLTARSREVVTLRYFQNRSGEEIAETVGIKITSVYQTIARVHKTLAECIRHQPEYHS